MFVKNEIAQGVDYISVTTDRFKTNELAIAFALPLDRKTASANALMINLLSRKCAKYNTMLKLNKKLAALYGASLGTVVSKVGECQVLKLGITSLNDRFAIDNESISSECIRLLLELVFEPDANCFSQQAIGAERRLLIEAIEAEENEKRTYAANRAQELMFSGEPYGVNKYGAVEDVEKITPEDVQRSREYAIKNARIMITTVGNTSVDEITSLLKDRFSTVERSYIPPEPAVFVSTADKLKERTERIDVKQGKLVLGYRVNLKSDAALTPAMRTLNDIFGGGPYSKLFANVRERLSLCYYCSSRYTRLKSFIMIQSGCLEENMDKAIAEIQNQLEDIRNGNFDEELSSSKIAIRDMLMSVNDSPDVIERWYINQITEDVIKTPEQTADENEAVTKEDVITCASLLSLDTIYRLTSLNKEAE